MATQFDDLLAYHENVLADMQSISKAYASLFAVLAPTNTTTHYESFVKILAKQAYEIHCFPTLCLLSVHYPHVINNHLCFQETLDSVAMVVESIYEDNDSYRLPPQYIEEIIKTNLRFLLRDYKITHIIGFLHYIIWYSNGQFYKNFKETVVRAAYMTILVLLKSNVYATGCIKHLWHRALKNLGSRTEELKYDFKTECERCPTFRHLNLYEKFINMSQ